jgi:hypothetical protein
MIIVSGQPNASNYIVNLLPASPAIDAGDDDIIEATFPSAVDARGEPRKFAAHVDIGAVEYNGVIDGVPQPPFLRTSSGSDPYFKISFVAPADTSFSVVASANLVDWSLLGSPAEVAPGLYVFTDRRMSLNKFFSIQRH